MQLSKIKIAGFKSFVDPTTISLPSHLVAIVGPNGCGKSNIIDAVTWVMGESSPKYLRGESLTDVIFNGSSARKPVGQASVELIFDNNDGSIGGEYSKYSEIAVKRMINRASDSTYYLNGVRCRKRDVVDIFLGTGLGPRSYSIIGQNMISRVIEAKPEELRQYLEEAAGISKYKERRHETELRIQHTKENLDRVNDLRAELDKQLSNLKHQANVAEKFKVLKEQERVVRAELYGIQWRQLDSKMVDYTLRIQRDETALEARHSEISSTDREIEQMRHEQRVAHDAFQEVQRRYYAVGNEITRIEQDILHHQERKQQWENDLKQSEADWHIVKEQMNETEENLRQAELEINDLEPQISSSKKQFESLQEQLVSAEEKLQDWQMRWDDFQQSSAKVTQTAQVEKTHIQHLEQKINSLQQRKTQLENELAHINFNNLNQEIEIIVQQAGETKEKLELDQQQFTSIRAEIEQVQHEQQSAMTQLNNVRVALQQLLGQQTSLQALQEIALGQRDNPIAPWIEKHQLADKSRLAQHLKVEKGWEIAVEKALGFNLQAICLDDIKEIVPYLDDLKAGNLSVYSSKQPSKQFIKKDFATLLIDKISTDLSIEPLLSGIYIANNLEEALTLIDQLDISESVITRDGIWLNQSWLQMLRQKDVATGIFEREQQLNELEIQIKDLQNNQDEIENHIHQQKETLHDLNQKRDQLQQFVSQQQAQLASINAQLKLKQERLNDLRNQFERLNKDQNDCTIQIDQTKKELVKARSLWQQAMETLEQQSFTRDELMQEREKARSNFQSIRDEVNQKKEFVHGLELHFQTAKSQKNSLQQAISRFTIQLASLSERKITLQSELTSMPPIDNLKKSLSRALDKHVSAEVELNTARVAVESLEQEFRHLEEKRQIIERDINKIRTHLESLRVELQGWKVKSDTILEQIKETEFTIEDILKQLPQEINADEWQIKLDQILQRINRLGPINLIAIDEYATCLERKQYLDKQLEDLQAGLATLEDAIAKIDKETRTRFKETFDKVNTRFQELFPTVFGGGKAYLELTSENLLEAGVTMMACPPGKRNSTIYLLSGGEKSLTAIALIFSIFYLNPAPFCLLDEVDAALDDANVLRFTRLVKAMADKTQFIFISHNKITIEMAEHLIGVTMNEPGVSRLVSVDIEKAMSLAGTKVQNETLS